MTSCAGRSKAVRRLPEPPWGHSGRLAVSRLCNDWRTSHNLTDWFDGDADGEASGTTQNMTEAQHALSTFWSKVTEEIKKTATLDLKQQMLPLARIKKIMKLDDEVKMISGEAPLLFAKAAEIFIHELTLRAWVHTEDNKRRTLQRNDIAMAITKFDQFDFLIDIVPRDELKPNKSREDANVRTASMNPDQVHYYFQLAQQHQAALQQSQQVGTTQATQAIQTSNSGQPTTIQILQPGGQLQTVGVVQSQGASPAVQVQHAVQVVQQQQQQQVIQLQAAAAAQQQQQQAAAAAQAQAQAQAQQQAQQQAQAVVNALGGGGGGIQIVQQIVTPSGEVQQIPIQLTPAQLQMIRMQIQGGTNQPIIIQTAPIQTIQQQSVVGGQGQPQIIQVASQPTGPTPVYLTQAAPGQGVGDVQE
ncbi:hypothetical protein J437_LFUL002150 [Ladona fulva]|uniref:Nuclear transcription factor Y subunit gamma n=1 Tax=Ladona fulva TaxID=123851 RepID=A0A8K0JYC0_LADFU|nr:hypothetical protein J437_LFUL002150 [Ladona fulva]